jgi:hypothetical protein
MSGTDHVRALHDRAGLRRAGTIVGHQGLVTVPPALAAVTLADEEALALGWDLTLGDVADERAEWPQHDPIKLGAKLAEAAGR